MSDARSFLGRPREGASAPSDGAVQLVQMRPALVAILRRRLADSGMAEDLCNETIRIVLERLKHNSLAEPAKLASFACQTARNLAIAELRKRSRRNTVTGEDWAIEGAATPAAGPLDEVQRAACAATVRQLLTELPSSRDRQLLARFYLQDEERAEICADLGLTEAHFNRVLFRARERFRTLVQRRHPKRDLLVLALVTVLHVTGSEDTFRARLGLNQCPDMAAGQCVPARSGGQTDG
jgi:RNA polymerase sigma-70 factor, ECF subfamily